MEGVTGRFDRLDRGVRHRVVGVMLVLIVAGCGSVAPSAVGARPLGPGERWLPVAEWGSLMLCAGVGYVGEFRLHGSPSDPRLAWMTMPDGSRRELAWEAGTSARFSPDLVVIGPDSQVIASEGSRVTGGCPTADSTVTFGDFTTPGPDLTDAPRNSGAR
jgi:hypothetical protein